MRKTLVIVLAMVLVATAAMAQSGWRHQASQSPTPPAAPKAPHGCSMHGDGPGSGAGCGMHGDRPMMRGHAGEPGLLGLREELGLSDQQVEDIEQLQIDNRMTMIDRRAEMQKAQLRLRTLMRDGDAAESEVSAAIDDLARLRADMQKAQYRQHQQVLSVLSEAQQEKLKQLREDRQSQRGEVRQEKQRFRDRRFDSSR